MSVWLIPESGRVVAPELDFGIAGAAAVPLQDPCHPVLEGVDLAGHRVPQSIVELQLDVLAGAEVRSAGGGAARCDVVARQADCRLESLGPGETTAVEVRLLVDRSPVSSKVTQQIRLTATDDVIVADQGVAVPVASGSEGLAGLLAGPGTAVTLGAALGLVLAARPRSRANSGRR